MKTEHILIIRFSAIGDVAMTVPVVQSLARQYPHLRITMLSKPFARCMFENLAPNVGFMEADIKREYRGVTGLNALYRRLVAKNFTAVADFHSVLRSEYLRMRFHLDQYKVAHINKHRAGRKRLTQPNNKVLEQQPSPFENYADVLAQLGYPVKVEFKSIFPEQLGGNLRLLPPSIGMKRGFEQWIGVAPFAAHKGKVYPLDKTEEVIASIIRKHPSCRIFLFGGGGEEKLQMNEWSRKYKNCTNASDALGSLYKELVLMSHLDVMLSMDSANMHLASLVNTPVVSVWGATHPLAGFMGWGQNANNAVQVDLDCRPCSIYGNKPCLRGDYACLNRIEPDMITDRLELILGRK